MSNGDGFGFSDVLDAINSSLSDLSTVIFNAILDAVAFLFDAVAFTWQVLIGNLNFQEGAWARVKGFFGAVFIAGFGKFLGALWNEIKKIKDLLRRIFDPILCTLEAIIRYEQTLFDLYIRPLLILIQRLRSALVLLRLLHVKWAGRLDARLGALETKLAGSLFAVLRELNTIRQTISLFVDPFGLFNPVVLFSSVLRSIQDFWNALHVAQERPLAASELDQQAADRRVFRKSRGDNKDDFAYFDQLAENVGKELSDITG